MMCSCWTCLSVFVPYDVFVPCPGCHSSRHGKWVPDSCNPEIWNKLVMKMWKLLNLLHQLQTEQAICFETLKLLAPGELLVFCRRKFYASFLWSVPHYFFFFTSVQPFPSLGCLWFDLLDGWEINLCFPRLLYICNWFTLAFSFVLKGVDNDFWVSNSTKLCAEVHHLDLYTVLPAIIPSASSFFIQAWVCLYQGLSNFFNLIILWVCRVLTVIIFSERPLRISDLTFVVRGEFHSHWIQHFPSGAASLHNMKSVVWQRFEAKSRNETRNMMST